MTSKIQPLDVGIIQNIKVHYTQLFNIWAIANLDTGAMDYYVINQLEAMRLAGAAWHEVDATTIQHCWRKAGILPNIDGPNIIQPHVSILCVSYAFT